MEAVALLEREVDGLKQNVSKVSNEVKEVERQIRTVKEKEEDLAADIKELKNDVSNDIKELRSIVAANQQNVSHKLDKIADKQEVNGSKLGFLKALGLFSSIGLLGGGTAATGTAIASDEGLKQIFIELLKNILT